MWTIWVTFWQKSGQQIMPCPSHRPKRESSPINWYWSSIKTQKQQIILSISIPHHYFTAKFKSSLVTCRDPMVRVHRSIFTCKESHPFLTLDAWLAFNFHHKWLTGALQQEPNEGFTVLQSRKHWLHLSGQTLNHNMLLDFNLDQQGGSFGNFYCENTSPKCV